MFDILYYFFEAKKKEGSLECLVAKDVGRTGGKTKDKGDTQGGEEVHSDYL